MPSEPKIDDSSTGDIYCLVTEKRRKGKATEVVRCIIPLTRELSAEEDIFFFLYKGEFRPTNCIFVTIYDRDENYIRAELS